MIRSLTLVVKSQDDEIKSHNFENLRKIKIMRKKSIFWDKLFIFYIFNCRNQL